MAVVPLINSLTLGVVNTIHGKANYLEESSELRHVADLVDHFNWGSWLGIRMEVLSSSCQWRQ